MKKKIVLPPTPCRYCGGTGPDTGIHPEDGPCHKGPYYHAIYRYEGIIPDSERMADEPSSDR